MAVFKPALIIVDVQEDFCPPFGSLAVADGRAIIPAINTLLTYPFALKIATKDFHPPDHISFASSHPPPHNKPFESLITISNPLNPEETQETRLWPDHCVQGTTGAELLPELDVKRVTHVIEKGQDKRVEMYSAFADPFTSPCVSRSGIAELLKGEGVTDVVVVGLAADYCVKCTALDARQQGFGTWVVGEATRAVDEGALAGVYEEYRRVGVRVVGMESVEVRKVKELQS